VHEISTRNSIFHPLGSGILMNRELIDGGICTRLCEIPADRAANPTKIFKLFVLPSTDEDGFKLASTIFPTLVVNFELFIN
jgi:hypothetical protein